MKSFGALQAHFESIAQTPAMLLKITRRDAQVFGFTAHDRDLSVGGVTYVAIADVAASALVGGANLGADNAQIEGGWLATGIDEVSLEAGAWDGAQWELAICNWADLSLGAALLKRGELGRVSKRGRIYVAELLGLGMRLQRRVGRRALPTCDADLGDARCKVVMTGFTHTASITTVTSRSVIAASALTQTPPYFRYGTIEWTSGANAGFRTDVIEHTAGGTLRLIIDAPYTPAVGDGVTVTRGCNKIARTADGGDCEGTFSNVVNFRGFPDVPGPAALVGALGSNG